MYEIKLYRSKIKALNFIDITVVTWLNLSYYCKEYDKDRYTQKKNYARVILSSL